MIISLTFLALFISCASPTYIKHQYDGKAIHFGDGGGFSGLEREWVVTDKGHVFFFDPSERSYIFSHQIEKNKKKQIFSVLQTISFFEQEVEQQGNTYDFLSLHHKDSIHRVFWDNTNPNAPSELLTLHHLLMTDRTK